jgi:formate C-acetyltransferase
MATPAITIEHTTEKPKKSSGLKRFVALIDQYFAEGGMQIQFNIVSKETLREAQLHPENYSDLLVRVAGYSAYFTQLSHEVQEDIIARTEQRL